MCVEQNLQDTVNKRKRRLYCPHCKTRSMLRIFIIKYYAKIEPLANPDGADRIRKELLHTSKTVCFICRNCARRTDIDWDLLYAKNGNTRKFAPFVFGGLAMEQDKEELQDIETKKRSMCIFCNNQDILLLRIGHQGKFFGYFCSDCERVYFKIIEGINWKYTLFAPHQRLGCEPEVEFYSIGGADYPSIDDNETEKVRTLNLSNLRVPTDPREKNQFMRLFNKLKKYETNQV